MITVGSVAPPVDLEDQFGRRFRLADRRGKRNVLFLFYPADFTPTCSREVPALAAMADRFLSEANTEVVAVSTDSRFAHGAWCAEMGGIRMPVLADANPHGAVSKAMGAWIPGDQVSDRATVIVDPRGIVRYAVSVTKTGERDLAGLLSAARVVAASYPARNPGADPNVGVRPAGQLATGRGSWRGVLFVSPACGHCKHVLRTLTNLGIKDVAVRDVSDDKAAVDLVRLTNDVDPKVPTLLMDGQVYRGRGEIEPLLVKQYA